MLQQQLSSLSAFITQYNPYFDTAFTNVAVDDKTGIVNNGTQVIFPNDTFGNYYYIRTASKLRFDYNKDRSQADNFLSLVVNAPCYLVAYVIGADIDSLVANLVATIGRYDETTRITEVVIHAEDVVLQELAQVLDKPNVLHALQTMPDNVALVSINFTLSFVYSLPELHCLTNPCKTC